MHKNRQDITVTVRGDEYAREKVRKGLTEASLVPGILRPSPYVPGRQESTYELDGTLEAAEKGLVEVLKVLSDRVPEAEIRLHRTRRNPIRLPDTLSVISQGAFSYEGLERVVPPENLLDEPTKMACVQYLASHGHEAAADDLMNNLPVKYGEKPDREPTECQRTWIEGFGMDPDGWLVRAWTPAKATLVSRKDFRVCEVRVLE